MEHFAGLDVSVKKTSICIVDDTGKIVREVKVASEPEALLAVLKNPAYHFRRIGLEAGPLSQWLFSAFAEAELPAVCVETRHMQAVLKAQINKTDRNDARSDSMIGWLNSEVAPSADVSVAVNEAGIAASLEASTVSENLPLPSASDVVTTSPRNTVAEHFDGETRQRPGPQGALYGEPIRALARALERGGGETSVRRRLAVGRAIRANLSEASLRRNDSDAALAYKAFVLAARQAEHDAALADVGVAAAAGEATLDLLAVAVDGIAGNPRHRHGADLFDRVELMLAIEDQFAGVEITDDDVEQIQVVGDLIRHLNTSK